MDRDVRAEADKSSKSEGREGVLCLSLQWFDYKVSGYSLNPLSVFQRILRPFLVSGASNVI